MTGTMSPTEELFTIAAIWTLVALGLSWFIKNWGGRVAFVVALVAIPFWELPYGYYTFQKLCLEYAKPKVWEQFNSQESICVDRLDSMLYSNLVRAGFKTIEVTGMTLGALPASASAVVSMTSKRATNSTYCLEFVSNIRMHSRMNRHDLKVVRVKDSRVMAEQSGLDWRGMAWQEEFSPLLGRGGQCMSNSGLLFGLLRSGTSHKKLDHVKQ